MIASDTNRAARIQRILRVAEQHGLDRGSLLARAGLTAEEILDPDARISVEKTIRLWRRIANLIDSPDIGLEVGSTFQLREAGVLGYAMMHSPTLQAAIKRLVRFVKLLNQRAHLVFEPTDDRWRLRALHQPLIPDFREPIDEGIVALVSGFRELLDRNVVASEVHFNYPRPVSTVEHRRLLGPNLRFDQPAAAIFLSDRDVRSSANAPDPHLTRYLDELAEIRVESLPQIQTYAGRVQQAVWPHPLSG